MCGRFGSVSRLFGLTAGENRVMATFWLLDAPDSLEAQSHRNVDGAGLGYFGPDGGVVLDKQPEPGLPRPGVRARGPAGRVPRVRGARPLGDGGRADGA